MATSNMIKSGLLIALTLFSALSAASSRKISSRNIHISGNVVAKPCTFDKTIDTVLLPTVMVDSVSEYITPFTISMVCPGITTVKVVPSGTPSEYGVDSFVNTGTAGNLHFNLYDDKANNTPIASDGSARFPVTIVNDAGSILFRISPRQTSNERPVTAGTMATAVNFRFDYD